MNYIIAVCKNGRLDLTTQNKNNPMSQFSLNHHYNTKISPDFFFLNTLKAPAISVPGNENKHLFQNEIPHTPHFNSILQQKKKP